MTLSIQRMSLAGTGIGPTMLVGRVETVRTMPDGTTEAQVAYMRPDHTRGGMLRAHARIRPDRPWDGPVHTGDIIVARGIAEAADGALRITVHPDRAALIHAHTAKPDHAAVTRLAAAIARISKA